jgi:hypothetical protein
LRLEKIVSLNYSLGFRRKAFEKVYEIKSRLSEKNGPENSPKTDWELYRLKTLCWRDVEELQRLHAKTIL